MSAASLVLSVLAVGCCALVSEDPALDLASSYYYTQDRPSDMGCPAGMSCTELTSCRLVYHLMERSCLNTHRLQSMRCGFVGREPMVCCPRGAFDSPFEGPQLGPPPGVSGAEPAATTQRPPRQPAATCGQPAVRARSRGLGSHPWVARVGFVRTRSSPSRAGQIDYPCCGSIISRTTILTAAHCAMANSSSSKLYSVRVGEYDGSADLDCTVEYCGPPVQDVRIKRVVLHPGFAAKSFSDDVALLVLRSPINYTITAQPICLLQNPKVPLVGRRATLVGWGKTPGQKSTPERQQLQELPVVPADSCKKLYNALVPISSRQLCVGGEEGKDACSGFGGAPLLLLDHIERKKYYQVGIASFGSNKCGARGIVSVYTKITSYVDWIQDNMTQ
ncbi:phenoloxidase-activating factor 3-like [Bacillus rossius redtenbacheri]|uniref:phenoloxidase-activating factor 3-like n=1 Tax=Bacillus rossius redtenbacheri TaxID=93214 RepID=UPI002FDE5F9F